MKAPVLPPGPSFLSWVSGGAAEPSGKCGVGQSVTTRPARPRCGKSRPVAPQSAGRGAYQIRDLADEKPRLPNMDGACVGQLESIEDTRITIILNPNRCICSHAFPTLC